MAYYRHSNKGVDTTMGDEQQKTDDTSTTDMSSLAMPPSGAVDDNTSDEDQKPGAPPSLPGTLNDIKPPTDPTAAYDDSSLEKTSTTPLPPQSLSNPMSDPLANFQADDAASPSSDPNPKPQSTTSTDSHDDDASDLIDIKKNALSQLSPLVGHLDQSPEEKFRTTMMMIQASDDSSMVKAAYDAAQKIEDDKTRAQALLDVINEINYFTQKKS